MTDSIELYSYPARKDLEEDIEVYHEIKPNTISETIFSSRLEAESVSNYDFFTMQQSKSTIQVPKNEKRKKSRKKNSPNLMDIINSELALTAVPIAENVIEIVGNDSYTISNNFDYVARDYRTMQRRQSYFDIKHRFQNSQTVHLNPVYPVQELLGNITSDHFLVEYVEPATYNDVVSDYIKTEDKQGNRFLEVEINKIKFKHHHKFSLESLLCARLKEEFDAYENIQQTLVDLSRDIKVNRETKNNLKKELTKVTPNKKDDLRFDATVRKYVGQLLHLKEKYMETIKEHRSAIHKIVSLWSDVEMVREKFKFRVTTYNLFIKKYNLSDNEFEKEWNDLYEAELTDMLDKIEFEYVTEYIEYKKAKNCQTLKNGSQKKLNKPRVKLEEDELKSNVERLTNHLIMREKVELSLVKIEGKTICTNNATNHYHFEVFADNTFVCETEYYNSDDEMLGADFTDYFAVEILPRNKELTITFFENDVDMANLHLNLSKVNGKQEDDFTAVDFQYSIEKAPTCENIGSGYSIREIAAVNKVRLKSSNIFKGKLVTTCSVLMKIRWREVNDQMEAIKASMGTGRQLQRLVHGLDKPSVEVLSDIIGKVYGQDIRNDDNMMNTIEKLCKSEVKTNDMFSVEENSSEHVRLKLLHLRNTGGFTHVENKIIPIHGSQISTEQLNCLQKTKEKGIDIEYLKSKEANMDSIELQRFIAAKYMQKLNKNVIKSLNEHLMVKTQKDVVREFENFTLRAIFSKQRNATSLAPISSNTKQQILVDSLNNEQDIHITVVRAFNLLERSTGIVEDMENDEDTIAGFKVRPLRPFVRVSYHGVSGQTVTAMGCHPTWNHTLKLSTKLNPLSTIHINVFDEYKESLAENDGLEDQSNRTVHYRYSSKWLGTAEIPLFTVLSLGILRGTFKITTPPLMFGYETLNNKGSSSLIPEVTQLMKKDTSFITIHITSSLSHLGGFQVYNQPLPCTPEDDYIIKHLNAFVTDHLNSFPSRNISLTFIDSAGRNKCVTQFLQPIPMPNRDFFPKNPKSCGSALSKSSGFSRSSSSKSSGRKREVDLEANVEKESVYSMGSWKGGDSLGKMINSCLRYVALIPSYGVTETHAITLTGLELLKVLNGTPLDHSILLASFFLYLGIRSWIAIGLGLPRGRSSFVIIQYDLTARRYVLTSDEMRSRSFLRPDGYVWVVCDAAAGERSTVRDVACPMKTVEYVFDSENIWVNVQSSQDCESVMFDFSRSSDWQPVFDKSMFLMKLPIVNDSNLYSPPSKVEPLRQSLETKIKGKLQKWRPHAKTIWNRYCSGLLRDALLYWEYWTFNSNENKPGYNHKFKQLMVTYKMSGFPLNVPFTSTKSIISAIKSTGVHSNDDPNVEFGLAVEVFAYPNNVLSVWVFLASISRV